MQASLKPKLLSFSWFWAVLVLIASATSMVKTANCAEPPIHVASAQEDTNSFPDLKEIFQGRSFRTAFDKNVFFLRTIHDSYPSFWPSLVTANIVLKDYLQSPDKLQRFIEELGTAMEGADDHVAITNLAAITSSVVFYANTNGYRPNILSAAGSALIKIGPKGRATLADSFSEDHYRTDWVSLRVFAEAIGNSRVLDSGLNEALAATAFTLTATNGGFYPSCTKSATHNLLSLPDGDAAVVAHFKSAELFKDPGRLQAVVEGIGTARALNLETNLVELATRVAVKLNNLPLTSSPYKDDLLGLQICISNTVELLHETKKVQQ
jgi:hypothetical protein